MEGRERLVLERCGMAERHHGEREHHHAGRAGDRGSPREPGPFRRQGGRGGPCEREHARKDEARRGKQPSGAGEDARADRRGRRATDRDDGEQRDQGGERGLVYVVIGVADRARSDRYGREPEHKQPERRAEGTDGAVSHRGERDEP